ncbi:MAG: M56 family metallopeptidase [Ignavibacteriaceae bacterium]
MIVFDKIGLILIHFAWQAAVIAFITGLILFMLKGGGAGARYNILCFSMLLMVVFPIYSGLSELIKDPYSSHGAAINQLSYVDTKEVYDKGTLIAVQFRSKQIEISSYEDIMYFVNRYTPFISIIWLLGVLLMTFYRIIGFSKVKSMICRAQPVADSFWEKKIKGLMQKIGIKQNLKILQSQMIDSPVVIGFLKPVLLIPVSFFTGIDSRYIEAILLHELAHIKRYDYFVNIFQLIIETLGFFHPAVWWISSRMRRERENCCDDFAVEITGDRVIFAKALVSLEEVRQNPSLMIAANGSNLLYRISRLLDKKPALSDSPFFNFTAPSIVALFLFASLGIVVMNSSNERFMNNLFKNIAHSRLEEYLAVYLPFNGNAKDESIFKQKTFTHNVSLCPDRSDHKNSAFDFNGKNSYIKTDKKNALNNGESITVSCWIYPRQAKNWESWICKRGTNWASEWRMGFGENKNSEWGFTTCNFISKLNMWTDYWITDVEIPLNKWTHVAVSADQEKSIVTVYMNGKKTGILRNLRNFEKSESPLLIGYQTDDNVYFDGKIDDIRIYNCVLSDEEVRAVYEIE